MIPNLTKKFMGFKIVMRCGACAGSGKLKVEVKSPDGEVTHLNRSEDCFQCDGKGYTEGWANLDDLRTLMGPEIRKITDDFLVERKVVDKHMD